MKTNYCRDNDVMICMLVKAPRDRDLDYFRACQESFALDFLHCVIFEGRFGRQEVHSTLQSSLRRMTQRVDEPLAEIAERTLKTVSDEQPGCLECGFRL